MAKFERKIEVEDEREWQGPGLNERGLYNRMKREKLTPEDVRNGKMKLREAKEGQEADDRNMVADMLKEYEKREQKALKNVEKNPILAQYKSDYEKWDSKLKARISFEEIALRLQAREGHYLKLAQKLQEGGILWGVDAEGNPLFADKGVEPVMKGMSYNKAFKELYGKDYPDDEKEAKDYMKAHDGYEMFDQGDDVRAVEKFTGEPFVANEGRNEYRSSHLFRGKNPSWSRFARFYPHRRFVYLIDSSNPTYGYGSRGVRRLLRVKKFES